MWAAPLTPLDSGTCLIALKNSSGWYLSNEIGTALFGCSGNWFNPHMMHEKGFYSIEELLSAFVKSGWTDILKCHIRLGAIVLPELSSCESGKSSTK